MVKSFKYNGKYYGAEDTALIRRQYSKYLASDEYNIYQAYKTPSGRKVRAWEECEKDCATMNGYGLKVAGHNANIFSAGFLFNDDEGRKIYCHITPTYDRFMIVE